jgi:hypothetical protein
VAADGTRLTIHMRPATAAVLQIPAPSGGIRDPDHSADAGKLPLRLGTGTWVGAAEDTKATDRDA